MRITMHTSIIRYAFEEFWHGKQKNAWHGSSGRRVVEYLRKVYYAGTHARRMQNLSKMNGKRIKNKRSRLIFFVEEYQLKNNQ